MHNATIQQARLQESPRQRECEETSLRYIACFSPGECRDWRTSRTCKILPEQFHPPSRRPPHAPSIWRGTLGCFLILVLGLGLLVQQSFAQENSGERLPDVTPPLTKTEQKREALGRILLQKTALLEKIDAARNVARDQSLTDFERSEAAREIASVQLEISELESEFSKVATGIDLGDLDETEMEHLDLNKEVKEIFRPLVQEFRDITAAPREAEELRTEIDQLQRRLEVLEAAEEALAGLQDDQNPAKLAAALEKMKQDLQYAKQDLKTELGIAEAKLADSLGDKPTFVRSISDMFQDFFRTRGLHLLVAVIAAGVTIFLLRLAYRAVMKVSPRKVNRGESLAGRIIHLGYLIMSVVIGILAFIIALYLANDWLLLAIALLFLFGVAWTGKQAVPRFFEQSKMMLNLGSVRSGERIIFEGIPWEVQKINLYTALKNPALEGGFIRLPMRDLMPLHSRPNGPRELWFPSREDDWVILSDGTFGKVIQQTPDYVHLVKLGGSRKVIPTADFLALHPENISKNFRITVTFGIDYSHQDIAVGEARQILEATIQRALLDKVNKEQLFSLKVFFSSASASSLDYRIVADFSGDLAPRMNALRDYIQATCVEACNHHGWIIPFTQITIHQASESCGEDSKNQSQKPELP